MMAGEDARAPVRKKQRRSGPGHKDYWTQLQGWQAVDVGEDFLLGAEEGGFAGLEVLDDVSIIDPELRSAIDAAAQQQMASEGDLDADGTAKSSKGKKQRATAASAEAVATIGKRGRADDAGIAASEVDGADVAALQARIKQLDAEKAALLKAAKRLKASAGASPSGKAAGGTAADAAAAAAADSHAPGAADGTAPAKKLSAKAEARQARKTALYEKKKEAKRAAAEAKKAARAEAAAAQQGQQSEHEGPPPDVDMSAWQPFGLHPLLLRALALQGFTHPTPIQEQALPAAARDRRDVIGAAQTGSGKTLAFGLPIMQLLLQEQELEQALRQQQAQDGEQGGQDGQQLQQKGSPLRALILTPTRELALQVCKHLQALGEVCRIRVVGIVGGLALVKQERLLGKRPEIVVATPGRLWALMRDGHAHLTDLSAMSFLVLDEADRMVQQGHFGELEHILDNLPQLKGTAAQAGPSSKPVHDMSKSQRETARERRNALRDDERRDRNRVAAQQKQQEQQDEEQQEEEEGEDIDEAVEEDAEHGAGHEDGAAISAEPSDGDGVEQQLVAGTSGRDADLAARAIEEFEAGPSRGKGSKGRLMQTFVFSATLTLPSGLRKRLRKGGGGSSGSAMLESLMDRLPFRGKPAIIDLTTARKLADRVEEATLECLDTERDDLLYYLLARHPGRTLVFVNAVSATRRVTALLKILGLPARALHAQQQQRQRLKALDAFKANEQAVLVATDVAARGLDIRDVACVVHYQMPASADTYIHRCGRTGRVGSSDGLSVALVAPGEAPRFVALCKALDRPPPPAFPVDKRVVHQAHLRVALALKIDALQRADRKQRATRGWLANNADAAGIDLSDQEAAASEDEDAAPAGDKRRAGAAAKGGDVSAKVVLTAKDQAALAKMQAQLAEMLAAPLQQTINARFFTGGAVAMAANAKGHAAAAAAAAVNEDGGDDSDEDVAAAAPAAPAAEAVAKTMQLAARLQQTRSAAAEQQARKRSGKGKSSVAAAVAGQEHALVGKQQKRKQGKKAAAKPDMSRLMVSRNELKRRQKGGLVVVGGGSAFGRDVHAPSALAALRGSRAM